MHPKYDGVKFYSNNDMSIGRELEKAEQILTFFDSSKNYDDINEVLELFNIQKLLETGVMLSSWTEDKYRVYCDISKQFNPIIGRFFGKIDESVFYQIQESVSTKYLNEFWNLFVKYKVYKRISPELMASFLNQSDTTLNILLKHKELVDYYEKEIADVLRTSKHTIDILVSKFLKKTKCNYYLPRLFMPSEFENILLRYVQSNFANPNVLQLIFKAQSTKECPIGDKLRLEAKRAYERFWNDDSTSTTTTSYGIEVNFKDQNELKVYEKNGSDIHISYDVKWLKETLDYPSILNNFRYVFEMFDVLGRSSLVSIKSTISALEGSLAVDGIKFYRHGNQFNFMDMLSSAQMDLYRNFLVSQGIYLEDVFKWFFEKYLPEEFEITGFCINTISTKTTYIEKCRNLAGEMDGVLKQFRMFVIDGCIDRELFEMSSEQLVLEGIPSLIDGKYAYSASDEIEKEMAALFSDQTLLGYTEKTKDQYDTLFKLLMSNNNMNLSDFNQFQIPSLKWLGQRGCILIDDLGDVKLEYARVFILKDLYDHDVLCLSAFNDSMSIIKGLVTSGDLKVESTLFSRPETDYLNYELNKSQFSDGLDLRNKYVHSTYPINENEQRHDYIQLLKLMVLIITKINDEFCAWDNYRR